MPYTDWIPAIDKTITNKDNLSLLEFGLGDGTKYLLDNFKHVHSYELNDHADPSLIHWYNKALADYADYKNWSTDLHWYNEIDFVDHSNSLSAKLTHHIDAMFDKYSFDVVFVDGAGHNRGLVADYILNKQQPAYVVIHDTNYAYTIDGYHKINLPQNYTTLKFTDGEGTHIFVKTA